MRRTDALNIIILPTLQLLPEKMRSVEAQAMLLAIGGQESGWQHRRQIQGPARGFYQFEPIGVHGVQDHISTSNLADKLTHRLNYNEDEVYDAIEHNDILATVFARLLLWTVPKPLPTNPKEGWNQYLSSWRPGKPHEERWIENWEAAWETIG